MSVPRKLTIPSRIDAAAAEKQIAEQTKRIEFYITEFSIELLANKMRNLDFYVPDYQREFTWEPARKSRFIESILMNLPIPFLFFWENPNSGKLEVVDGSQRLRTIEEFILGGLRLGELDQLSLVSGFRFTDLPESRQRKVQNRSIRGIVLNEHADEQSRFDLFDRINTGSKQANLAEIRRGALSGPFLDLVIELAIDPVFMGIAPMSIQQRKLRESEELVTRFFAYSDGLDGYQDRVANFLFAYSKKMNSQFAANPALRDIYRQKFHVTMQFILRNCPNGFRRTPNGNATPRARFEAIAVGTRLAIDERPILATETVSTEWLDSEKFRDVTGSDGANAIARLNSRIHFVKDNILGSSNG